MIKCGKHSGFPACCIKYYITVHMWRSDFAMKRYTMKTMRRGVEVQGKQPGYIPCPACAKDGKFIKKVKGCGCTGLFPSKEK